MVGDVKTTTFKQPVNQKILDCFWSLASENQQERVEAPRVLCEELDYADDEDDGVVYVCNRLVTGLCSSRAAARQGFALALTVWLKYRASRRQITKNYALVHTLASKLERQLDMTKVGDTTEAARESREVILGSLFGIAALAKTELIGLERVFALLQRLVSQKKWSTGLNEAVLQVAIECLATLDGPYFRKKGSTVRKAVVQWIKQRGIGSPDALTLALFCRNQFEVTNLASECPYWCEEDPVILLMKEKNPLVSKADVKEALETVFSMGSSLPSDHVPYSWYVWLKPLSNVSDEYFNEWWHFFIQQGLLQRNSSRERTLLGLRFTIAFLERNSDKTEKILKVVDDSFLSSLLLCCHSPKKHSKQEAIALREKFAFCIEKFWSDDLCEYLIERLSKFAAEPLGYADKRLLSLSASKLSLKSVTRLCNYWRENIPMTENAVNIFSTVFAYLSCEDAQDCLFPFVQERVLDTESGKSQKWKDSVLNCIGNTMRKENNVLLLVRLGKTALRRYQDRPFHGMSKVGRIFEFCRQQISRAVERNGQDVISETLLACSLSILICLFTEEDKVREWLERNVWPLLKGLSKVEEGGNDKSQEQLKSITLVKFLVACLSLESHGLRQMVKLIFEKVVPLGDENILSLLLSYLPGNVHWKELRELQVADGTSDVEDSLLVDASDSDEASVASEVSDSNDSEVLMDPIEENTEKDDELPSFDDANLLELDVDKNPDEEDNEILEAYDAKISAMLKEMDPKSIKNSYQRKLHEALRVLDLVELVLHSQKEASEMRIQLPSRLWLSVFEMNEMDWMNRIERMLQKVFLRESVVSNVSRQHYLSEMEFLKKILHHFYGDSKLLSEEAFRIGIFIFAYLLKGICRRYQLESSCETDRKSTSLNEVEGYSIVDEMIQYFSHQSFAVTGGGKLMEKKFSMAKVALLQENLWKRVPFACYGGVKCLCSIYNRFRSRVMRRTCLGVLQTAVKLVCSNSASNGRKYHEQSRTLWLQDEGVDSWLQALRSFLVATISSLQLRHYHDLFAKCISIILVLSRNGYELGDEVHQLLQRKLSEYPSKQIPPSVTNLFQSLQKESLQSQSHSGKRVVKDRKDHQVRKKLKQT